MPLDSVPPASLHRSWRLLHEVEAWTSSVDPAAQHGSACDCQYVPHAAYYELAEGLPPYTVPNFQFVGNRDIPRLGTWVWLSGVLEPREPGCPPVLCFVYWNTRHGRWSQFASVANEDGFYASSRARSSARHCSSRVDKGTQTAAAEVPVGTTAPPPTASSPGGRFWCSEYVPGPPSDMTADNDAATPASSSTVPMLGGPETNEAASASWEPAHEPSSPFGPDWIWGLDPRDPWHDHYTWIRRAPPGPTVLVQGAPTQFGPGSPRVFH